MAFTYYMYPWIGPMYLGSELFWSYLASLCKERGHQAEAAGQVTTRCSVKDLGPRLPAHGSWGNDCGCLGSIALAHTGHEYGLSEAHGLAHIPSAWFPTGLLRVGPSRMEETMMRL